MNIATFPGFLNAACSRPKPDTITLRFAAANPTQGGFTITDTVTVKSTYNGEPHTETYPAGTTSISFNADADTDVIIIGSVTSFSCANANILFSSIIINSSSINEFISDYSGQYNHTIQSIEINSESLTRLQAQYLDNLNNLSVVSRSLLNIDLQYDTILEEFNGENCQGIKYLDTNGALAISVLNLSNSTDILSFNHSAPPQAYGFTRIYYRATNQSAANDVANVISKCDATDGVVYLNSDDTYYQTVADAATAKGWTIEALPA